MNKIINKLENDKIIIIIDKWINNKIMNKIKKKQNN